MKPTDDPTDATRRADPGGGPDDRLRTDGSGETDENGDLSERAAAFQSDMDVSGGARNELQEFYDRKVYAPLQILLGDYRGVLGLTICLGYVLMGTVGVALVPRPAQSGPPLLGAFQNMAHPLGTDPSGKDLLRMVVHATPRMLQMMVGGALFSTALAVGVGTLSGFKRGAVDRVLMTIADTSLTLPGLPLLIVLVAILQPSNPFLIGVILSINAWAGGARSLRAQVLQIRNEDYVEATRAMGISSGRNIQKNVMPQLLPLVTINTMNALRNIIYAAVGLYFLNILPPNYLNWGVMLNLAYNQVNLATWSNLHYLLVPMITISLFGIGTIFLAQAFDRVFNPRLRAKHAKTLVGSDDEGGESADAAAKDVMFQ